jgi:hypothetical protein
MSPKHPDGPEALIPPFYFIAFLLVVTPTMDFVTSILPLRWDSIEWRFATVGLLSGFLLTPLLGLIIATTVAHLAKHLRFQRILAIVNVVITVSFAALFVLFMLDVFQLKSVVQEEAVEAFNSAATKAAIKHVAFIIALGWLSYAGFRISRWSVRETRRKPAAIVVGSP